MILFILLPQSSQKDAFFFFPNMNRFSFFGSFKPKLCAHIFLVVKSFTEVWLTGGHSFRGHNLPLTQQLTTALSSAAIGGWLCSTPFSVLGFGVAHVCTDLMDAATSTVSSYVQLPCWI